MRAHLTLAAQWLTLGTVVGLLCGSSSALFLFLLEWATEFRVGHASWVYALPLAGLALGWAYERWGAPIKGGNNLVIDTLRDGGPQVPLRMAPMVLAGTLITHFFGGSAGREGTAVQMGASLADWASHRFALDASMRRATLAAGVAGGFGAVFGTPLAGTLFALEFTREAKFNLRALVPAMVASFVGDASTRALGIEHTRFPAIEGLALSVAVVGKWLAFAAAIALMTLVFIELTQALKKRGERHFPRLSVRMAVGGVLVVGLWKLAGSDDFLGLGLPTLLQAFHDPTLPSHTFALKMLFTSVTLGAGFIGGEVTPLFVMGAALGNALAQALGLPLALGAGVGMAATFAAASNTPMALSVMALELLGVAAFPHAALVCVVAWALTGKRSIYPSQFSPQVSREPDGRA